MRTLRWLPLTFIAGLHGFALFAAYAAVVMLVFLLLRSARRRRPLSLMAREPAWVHPRPTLSAVTIPGA